MKRWKKYISGFLAATVLFTSSGFSGVSLAAEKKDVISSNTEKNEESYEENEEYEEYEEFSSLETEEKEVFLQSLDAKRFYQFVKTYKYLFIKNLSLDERPNLEECWIVLDNWREKREELSEDETLKDETLEDVDKEYLQTISKFDVKECLDLMESIEKAKTDEELAKAKESFSDFCDQVYGFDEPSNEDEEVIISKEEMQKLAYTITSIEGISLNDTGLYMEMGISVDEINTFNFDEISKFKANLGDGSQEDIEVKWVNEDIEDISKSKKGNYEFQIRLPEGYTWENTIQEKFDIGEYKVPYVKLNIYEEQKNSNERATVTIPRYSIIPLYGNDTIEVMCQVSGSGYASVEAPTWSTPNGQDDIIWHKLGKGSWTRNGSTFNYATQIKISNHGGYLGKFNTHFYALDSNRKVITANCPAEYCYGSARINTNYYKTLADAVDSVKENASATVYVLRTHTSKECHDFNNKSLTILPEGGNWTVSYRHEDDLASGLIRQKDGATGKPVITLKGNGEYTLTLDGGKVSGSSGLISSVHMTINLQKGVNITNSLANGVWNAYGITNVSGANLYNNLDAGIASFGSIYVTSGNFYNNGTDGIRAWKEIKVTGGNFYGNGTRGVENAIYGIKIEGNVSGKLTIDQANIWNNGSGIYIGDNNTAVLNKAMIYSNQYWGVNNEGSLTINNNVSMGYTAWDGNRNVKYANNQSGNIYNKGSLGIYTSNGNYRSAHNGTGSHIYNDTSGTVGIWYGTTQNYYPVFTGNAQNGIVNKGKLDFNKGYIYDAKTGIYNTGICTVGGGNIQYSTVNGVYNTKEFTMSAGTIALGNRGVQNTGTFTLTGGEIYSNTTKTGAGVYNTGTFTQSGGTISKHNSEICAVYIDGIYNFKGGKVTGNQGACDVYLNRGKVVNWWGHTDTGKPVINSAVKSLGTPLVKFQAGTKKGSDCEAYFTIKYAAYPELIGRGGNRNESASDSLVISRSYKIQYHANITEAIKNLPSNGVKYWNESYKIPSNLPVWDAIEFKGWNTSKDATAAKWQPEDPIDATVNQDLTLYAIWEEKILIVYDTNESTSGSQKTELVTKRQCDANQGYKIRKNKGYTDFALKNHTFAGWDPFVDWKTNALEVQYSEKKDYILSFAELKDIAEQQKEESQKVKNTKSNSDIPVVTMEAMWDEAPKIEFKNKEYYEGERVTKEDLLKDISARDREDGDLTEKLEITRIEYADGKLLNGVKQAGEVKEWPQGMPDSEYLDTWFLQMDKEDSPVVHKITYQVTDSAGNTVQQVVDLKVKYNNFPVIEAEDRYFTLEEARSGVITEEVLLKGALDSGNTKVTDVEDDQLYPNTISTKLEILNFHPEEFTQFTDSGYVVLTYHVQDSMGKDSVCQFTVYVVKDGEIPEKPVSKKVRFINEKYYYLNAEISKQELSEEEKEYYNKNGGLHVDSKWYHDPEYVAEITECWDETKPSDQIWEFTKEDVEKVKEYVSVHGIGNSLEENALAEFVKEFARCRIK